MLCWGSAVMPHSPPTPPHPTLHPVASIPDFTPTPQPHTPTPCHPSKQELMSHKVAAERTARELKGELGTLQATLGELGWVDSGCG